MTFEQRTARFKDGAGFCRRWLQRFVAVSWVSSVSIGAAEGGDPVEEGRWEFRFVGCWAASEDAAREVEAAWGRFAGEAEERDLCLVSLGPVDVDGGLALDEDARAHWRERSGLGGEALELVLIGKDGGVKARQVGEVELEAFFALIDTMPMRRAEIRAARSKEEQR